VNSWKYLIDNMIWVEMLRNGKALYWMRLKYDENKIEQKPDTLDELLDIED